MVKADTASAASVVMDSGLAALRRSGMTWKARVAGRRRNGYIRRKRGNELGHSTEQLRRPAAAPVPPHPGAYAGAQSGDAARAVRRLDRDPDGVREPLRAR